MIEKISPQFHLYRNALNHTFLSIFLYKEKVTFESFISGVGYKFISVFI